MPNAERTLERAIAELRCIDATSPASLTDLHALSLARQSIDELLDAAVAELRADPQSPSSWTEIARAIGAGSPAAASQRLRPRNGDDLVADFWGAYRDRIAWDFAPAAFLHALYAAWMQSEHPKRTWMSAETFTRRLKPLATADGAWEHTRIRPDALLRRPEPLLGVVAWRPSFDGRAVWGFRRQSR
jgi:hypothetical protein